MAPRPQQSPDVDRAIAHDLLYDAVVRLPPSEIVPLLAVLADRLGVSLPRPAARPVTTDELRRLAAHPLISIGIHTVNHPRLTMLSPDQARCELTQCRASLDELLGSEQRVLAYPFGVTSRGVADIAASTGIRRALTTDSRWVRPREDPMFVPRLHAPDLGGAAFRDWVETTSGR